MILDSRGNPTVEVEVVTDTGALVVQRSGGASTGEHECKDATVEILGWASESKGYRACKYIIASQLVGESVFDQRYLDWKMLADGTKQRKLGANAILGCSMAIVVRQRQN